MESYTEAASTEYSDISTVDYNAPPPGIELPGPSIPPSPLHTRSGKRKRGRRIEKQLIKVMIEKESMH